MFSKKFISLDVKNTDVEPFFQNITIIIVKKKKEKNSASNY